MKITIDLEDLVNDFAENASQGEYGIEDQFELKKELKQSIISQVTHNHFRNEIIEMRSKAHDFLKKRIAEKIDEVVEKQVERIIREDKFKYNSYEGEKTLSEYIKDRFIGATRDSKVNLDKITKDIAVNMASELKDRYDLLFASQIVTKLNEQGMLKEDVARLLLGDNNKEN